MRATNVSRDCVFYMPFPLYIERVLSVLQTLLLICCTATCRYAKGMVIWEPQSEARIDRLIGGSDSD